MEFYLNDPTNLPGSSGSYTIDQFDYVNNSYEYLGAMEALSIGDTGSATALYTDSVQQLHGEPETVISVSTSFFPGSHPEHPNAIFSSSDGVFFYVNTEVLDKASEGAFQAFIAQTQSPVGSYPQSPDFLPAPSPTPPIVGIPETSAILNVILHALYGTSCASNSPTVDALIAAVDRMAVYGIPPKKIITRTSPLHSILLSCSPLYPLQIYALAAHWDLYDLAVQASPYLLSSSLANITDEIAERIGALYLKRLFDLHLDRFKALRKALLSPPHPHPPIKECGFAEQKKLTRGWALVSAYLAWDATADLPTQKLRTAFESLGDKLTCNLCRESLEERAHDVIIQWTSVKRTI
ncbi:hypothetical protein AX16_009867 [Volvariella volvacea WC 439]|nr:hypothetical protein AX16_009867 [Volvariella volvacea WC 439]